MLRENKEVVMTILDTLNFVAFNPLQSNNPIAVRRRKLMARLTSLYVMEASHFSLLKVRLQSN